MEFPQLRVEIILAKIQSVQRKVFYYSKKMRNQSSMFSVKNHLNLSENDRGTKDIHS